MYEVFKVDGGWQVYWVDGSKDDPNAPRHPVRVKPYKQPQGAYRKRKQLNDAAKETDQMIAEKGAIII
jgi:hypothetical protein